MVLISFKKRPRILGPFLCYSEYSDDPVAVRNISVFQAVQCRAMEMGFQLAGKYHV